MNSTAFIHCGRSISTTTLMQVSAGIDTESGGKTASFKTVSPNAATYDIKNLDSYMKFARLPGSEVGVNYYFRVSATDVNGNTVTLANQKFTVEIPVARPGLENVTGWRQIDNLCTSCAMTAVLQRRQYVENKKVTFTLP